MPLNSIVPRKFPWTLSNSWVVYFISCNEFDIQNQSSGGILRKSCSKNIQQIYKRLPMPKCDLKKFAKKIYWSHISAWVFSCKFGVHFQNNFLIRTSMEGCFWYSQLRNSHFLHQNCFLFFSHFVLNEFCLLQKSQLLLVSRLQSKIPFFNFFFFKR